MIFVTPRTKAYKLKYSMLNKKFAELVDILKKMQSAVLAYSGGVDSTFLLKAVQLSGIKALAVTASSETMPENDLLNAKEMAGETGIKHKIIKTAELKAKKFFRNPVNRCFYCKDELFGKLKKIAGKEGYKFILDGSNLDDTGDWRPGRKAALNHGVRSPLIEAGLTKQEIRKLSKKHGLPTWDRPSSPCLASRFPYGEEITSTALRQVKDAENFLRALGFKEFRARHHKDIVRIELKGNDIKKILSPEIRTAIARKFKSLGYKFVALDLEEFRSGRLNELLKK